MKKINLKFILRFPPTLRCSFLALKLNTTMKNLSTTGRKSSQHLLTISHSSHWTNRATAFPIHSIPFGQKVNPISSSLILSDKNIKAIQSSPPNTQLYALSKIQKPKSSHHIRKTPRKLIR